jgi:hypothetical protein
MTQRVTSTPPDDSENSQWLHVGTPPVSNPPLVERPGPAYDESMFRVLLMLLVIGQGGFLERGTCCGGEIRSLQIVQDCRASVEQVTACCRAKVSRHVGQQVNPGPSSKSDGGDERPCRGCCRVSVVYCLLPDTMVRSDVVSCDRVEVGSQSLSGISGDPLTPPPKSNGVC